MPSPSPTSISIRPDLVAVLEEFDLEANMAGFIGLRLFPVSEVALQSENIGRITIESLLKQPETRRASGAAYNETNFEFEDFSYSTKDYGQTIPIDDRLRNVYRNAFDAEVVGAKMVRHIVMQAHENRVVALLTDTSVYDDAAASALWSNKASADPVADVLARLKAVRNNSGQVANTVAMDYETWLNCIECASVIDRLKSSGYDDPKNVNERAMASLFKVPNVVISGSQKNTAVQNVAGTGLSLKPSWPRDKVAVGCVATSNNLHEPCVGRTFHWAADGSSIGSTLETWENPEKRSTMIRARMETDEKRVRDECWSIITGTAGAP